MEPCALRLSFFDSASKVTGLEPKSMLRSNEKESTVFGLLATSKFEADLRRKQPLWLHCSGNGAVAAAPVLGAQGKEECAACEMSKANSYLNFSPLGCPMSGHCDTL